MNDILEMLIRRSRGASPVPPTPTIPTDYVFYAPLVDYNADTDETGRTLVHTGSYQNETLDGVPCVGFDGTEIYTTDVTGIPTGKASWTQSIWVRFTGWGNSGCMSFGASDGSKYTAIHIQRRSTSGHINGGGWYLDYEYNYSFLLDTWYNVVQTYDGTTFRGYVNGVLTNTSVNGNVNVGSGRVCIGSAANGMEKLSDGYLASARIYDRVLTDDEISLLATEFTPFRSISFDATSTSFISGISKSTQLVAEPSGCTFSTSDTLPSGVSLSSAGVLSFDGSTISQDSTVNISVTASKTGYVSDTATVTIIMSTHITAVVDAPLATSFTPTIGTFVSNANNWEFVTLGGVQCIHSTTSEMGSSKYLGMQYTPSVAFNGTDSATLSIWAYATDDSTVKTDWIFLYGIGSKSNSNNFSIEFRTKNDDHFENPWGKFSGNYALSRNSWHHLVLTYDRTNARLYDNGVLVYTSGDINITMPTTNVFFGGRFTDGRPWVGYLRNGKAWNIALTSQEVANLYASELPTFQPQS